MRCARLRHRPPVWPPARGAPPLSLPPASAPAPAPPRLPLPPALAMSAAAPTPCLRPAPTPLPPQRLHQPQPALGRHRRQPGGHPDAHGRGGRRGRIFPWRIFHLQFLFVLPPNPSVREIPLRGPVFVCSSDWGDQCLTQQAGGRAYLYSQAGAWLGAAGGGSVAAGPAQRYVFSCQCTRSLACAVAARCAVPHPLLSCSWPGAASRPGAVLRRQHL